jgi:ankyrin repeat protein
MNGRFFMKIQRRPKIMKQWLLPALALALALLVAVAGAAIASADPSLDQQLLEAAKKRDLTGVKALLDQGADPNAKDHKGNTVLMAAALGGRPELVKFLIDQGVDVAAKRPDGETVLMHAAVGGNPEIIRLLIQKGLDVNAKTSDGMTPLMFASMGTKLEAVKCLVDEGADVNARTGEATRFCTTQRCSCIQQRSPDISGPVEQGNLAAPKHRS